jgi:hypothetical protein
MVVSRGTPVLYKGKAHMYLGASRFIKGRHMVARQDKGNIVLTTIKTSEFVVTTPMFFNFGLTPEQEAKLAKF